MSLQEEVIRIMTDPLCSVEHRADKIVSKVLDAAVEAIKKQPRYMCDVYYNAASPTEDEYGNCLNEDKIIESINKLRPES